MDLKKLDTEISDMLYNMTNAEFVEWYNRTSRECDCGKPVDSRYDPCCSLDCWSKKFEEMEINTCKNPINFVYRSDTNSYRVLNDENKDYTGYYVHKEVADELLSACKWALEQFSRLADEGHYPEFMLMENGGEGMMPLVNAIKNAEKTNIDR